MCTYIHKYLYSSEAGGVDLELYAFKCSTDVCRINTHKTQVVYVPLHGFLMLDVFASICQQDPAKVRVFLLCPCARALKVYFKVKFLFWIDSAKLASFTAVCVPAGEIYSSICPGDHKVEGKRQGKIFQLG